MKVSEALQAMQNLGVSLNDYDSEALDTLIYFCSDYIQARGEPKYFIEPTRSGDSIKFYMGLKELK